MPRGKIELKKIEASLTAMKTAILLLLLLPIAFADNRPIKQLPAKWPPNTMFWLIATHDLQAGVIIKDSDLEWLPMPYFGPATPTQCTDCFYYKGNVVGHALTQSIRKHEFVRRSMVR